MIKRIFSGLIVPLLGALAIGAFAVVMSYQANPADGTIQWDGNGSGHLPCPNGAHWVLAPSFNITSATLVVDGVGSYPMTQNGNGSWSADSGALGASVTASVNFTGSGDDRNSLELSHCLSPANTATPTVTASATEGQTATSTATFTLTPTQVASNTPTPTEKASDTPTPQPTQTGTATGTKAPASPTVATSTATKTTAPASSTVPPTATLSPTPGVTSTASKTPPAKTPEPSKTPEASKTAPVATTVVPATQTQTQQPGQAVIGVAAFCDTNQNGILDYGDAPIEHAFVKVGLTGTNVVTYWIGETDANGLSGLYSGQITSVTPLSATAPSNQAFLSYWELPNDKNVVPFQHSWPRLVNPKGDLVRVAALFACTSGPVVSPTVGTSVPDKTKTPGPATPPPASGGGLPIGPYAVGAALILGLIFAIWRRRVAA